MSSVAYYDANAEAFFRRTVDADMSELRARFLGHLPPRADILDAGCGSGRDAAAFVAGGHLVTAFDASAEMVRLARAHTGLPVLQMTFADVAWVSEFDGIWASASLLHVPRAELPSTLTCLARALRPTGVLYVSMKLGTGERTEGERTFTDVTPAGMEVLADEAGLEVVEVWQSSDTLSGRPTQWVNALLRRRPS